jgi:hypothetical protein
MRDGELLGMQPLYEWKRWNYSWCHGKGHQRNGRLLHKRNEYRHNRNTFPRRGSEKE